MSVPDITIVSRHDFTVKDVAEWFSEVSSTTQTRFLNELFSAMKGSLAEFRYQTQIEYIASAAAELPDDCPLKDFLTAWRSSQRRFT